ncbi:MAG: sigma-70 family RNA polymerase sigma factor [Planctomycetota bacterium]|nr:sigma-70 family RNA polymerase sigma factor [Planctomycetota bacterium]
MDRHINPDVPHTNASRSRGDPSAFEPPCTLLERLRRGDDAAFDELVAQSASRLFCVAQRLLRNEADASDAVQEAYLSAFKALDTFDGRSQLGTWLHRITVNVCLMKLRSARRRPTQSIEALLPTFAEDGHRKNPGVEWKPAESIGIEREGIRAVVRAKIDALPDPYREVLVLRDIEQMDTDEVATLLGLSPAAVKTRLHRARQALRTLLTPLFTEGVLHAE